MVGEHVPRIGNYELYLKTLLVLFSKTFYIWK